MLFLGGPVAGISDNDAGGQRRAEFAHVFAKHYGWLQTYTLTLVGNRADAEEVFQDICLVLWRKYEAFDVSTNFMKWSSVIAHHEVRRFRRAQARRGHVLSDEIVNMLAVDAVDRAGLYEDRRAALQKCMQKLSSKDHDLIERYYSDARATISDISERIGRPVNTLYKAMSRIRRSLHECVSRSLSAEGSA